MTADFRGTGAAEATLNGAWCTDLRSRLGFALSNGEYGGAMWRRGLVVGWLASAVCAGAAGQPPEESACRLVTARASSVYAQCSTLEVPANPNEPSGPALSLFVARIPALAAAAADDPLVLIAGGPGQSAVDLYLQIGAAFDPILRQRDILLMDQRGTGRSADGFICSVPEDIDFQTADRQLLRELVTSCQAALSHDPRHFTTSIAVGDLDRLREAFGVSRWNLYGVSYGTRVAQHYLRRYPEHVRSVILDGVVPPDLVLGPDIADHAQAALDGIFGRCKQDRACSARFGALDQKFMELLRRLDQPGLTVAQSTDSGTQADIVVAEHLLGVTRLMSYSAATAALLPLTIDEAYHGRYDTLIAQAEILIAGTEQAISFPMHNAVACSEDIALVDDDGTIYGAGTYLGSTIMGALSTICADWPVGPVDADFNELLVTDKPVLLLSGGNDPVTPASYAEHVKEGGLTNAAHIVAQDQGHGIAAVGCVPRLIESFIETTAPDHIGGDCLKSQSPTPFFLSIAGPAP